MSGYAKKDDRRLARRPGSGASGPSAARRPSPPGRPGARSARAPRRARGAPVNVSHSSARRRALAIAARDASGPARAARCRSSAARTARRCASAFATAPIDVVRRRGARGCDGQRAAGAPAVAPRHVGRQDQATRSAGRRARRGDRLGGIAAPRSAAHARGAHAVRRAPRVAPRRRSSSGASYCL